MTTSSHFLREKYTFPGITKGNFAKKLGKPRDFHEKSAENFEKALLSFHNVAKTLNYSVETPKKFHSYHKNAVFSKEKRENPAKLSQNVEIRDNFREFPAFPAKIQREIAHFFAFLRETQRLCAENPTKSLINQQISAISQRISGLLQEIARNFAISSKNSEINSLSLALSQKIKENELLSRFSSGNREKTRENRDESSEFRDFQAKYNEYFESSQRIIKEQQRKLQVLCAKLATFRAFSEETEGKLRTFDEKLKEIDVLRLENRDFREKVRSLRETLSMQREETLAISLENAEKSQKTASLLANLSKTSKKTLIFPEETRFIAPEVLKDVSSQLSGEFSRFLVGSSTELQENATFSAEIEKFRVWKPNFLQNFSKLASFSLKPGRFHGKSQWFLATTRGILDSKHNELFLSENYKDFSDFPDFVFSWLSVFFVDEDTRRVSARNVPISLEIVEDFTDFLLKFGKSWEIFTFKEFLQGKACKDEVFFYLHCRFLLFRGPQLNCGAGKFEYVHFVGLERIMALVEMVFTKFDANVKQFIRHKLKDAAKLAANSKEIVDSAFALRVFLEYYRLERALIFQLLRGSFKEIAGKNAPFVKSFRNFEKIVGKLFPNLKEIEKYELFSQSAQVCKGNITPEAIFAAICESGLLIKVIKSQFFLDKTLENEYGVVLGFVHKNFKQKSQAIELLKQKSQEFGVENFFENFAKLQTIFLEKNLRFFKRNSFFGRNLLMVFADFVEKLAKIRNVEVLNAFNQAETEVNLLKNDLFLCDNVFALVKSYEKMKRIREFEENHAAKLLQNRFRKGISKWYLLMKQLLPGNSREKLL